MTSYYLMGIRIRPKFNKIQSYEIRDLRYLVERDPYPYFYGEVLRKRRIPIVLREMNGSLFIYSVDEIDEIIEDVNFEKHEIEIYKTDRFLLEGLISNAVRVAYYELDAMSASWGVYFPRDTIFARSGFYIYPGLRFCASQMSNNSYFIFIDFKTRWMFKNSLEYYFKRDPLIVENLEFFVLKDANRGIELLEVLDRDDVQKLLGSVSISEYLGHLGNYLGTTFPSDSKNYAFVRPQSRKLYRRISRSTHRFLLKSRHNAKGFILPIDVLIPQARLENLKELLPELVKDALEESRLKPNERVERIRDSVETLKETRLMDYVDIIDEISPWSPIESKARQYVPKAVTYHSSINIDRNHLSTLGARGVLEIFKVNFKNPIRLFIAIALNKELASNGFAINNIKKFTVSLRSVVSEYLKVLSNMPINFEVFFVDLFKGELIEESPWKGVPVFVYDSQEVLKSTIHRLIFQVEKCKDDRAIIFISDCPDKISSLLIYESTQRGIVPQIIDAKKIIEDLKRDLKKSKKANPYTKGRFYAFAIVKRIVRRLGYKFLRPHPTSIERVSNINAVVGIDSTIVPDVKTGDLRISVAAAILDLKTLNEDYQFIYCAEENAIINLIENISHDKNVVVYINRNRIRSELLNFLDNDNIIAIVAATKTHRYSRILSRSGNKYVNPREYVYSKISKFSIGSVEVSRYLAVGTHKPTNEWTSRTILYTIASKDLSTKDILEFSIDLTLLNTDYAYRISSWPWPNHRTDQLTKKINRIIRHTQRIPSRESLRYM